MKKIFVIAILALMTVTASAQLITSSRVSRGEKAHNWWVDLGAGGFTGDVEDMGLGLDLGIRYTKMWGNFGWDILKVSAQTPTKHFEAENIDFQLKTGFRYISHPITNNIKIYGNVAAGFWADIDNNPPTFLVWEIGAGAMLNDRVSVGIVFNNHDYKGDVNVGYLAGRISFAL